MRPRRILITGCGASGTMAIHKVFKRAKVPFGHERLLDAGMASWWCAAGKTGKDRPHGYNGRTASVLDDFGEQQPIILHQVRHPLHTISTVQRFSRESWRWICQFEPKVSGHGRILTCMQYWYYWNLKAEALAEWTYQIEQLKEVWPQWCRRVGHPEWEGQYKQLGYFKKNIHSRRRAYKPLSWKSLQATDKELTERIRELGRRYGYKV